VDVLAPPGVVSTSCSDNAQSAAATAVLSAVANQTTATGGAVSCSFRTVSGRRNMQAVPSVCAYTTSSSYVTYLVPVIVPPSGSASTALAAINALTAASYTALFTVNAAASGCPSTSFIYAGTTATAACGTGATNASSCTLPGGSAATVNVGAIIGGVLGGFAAFALFVALVFVARGACACCGPCCPRPRLTEQLAAGSVAAATPAHAAKAVAV
jgi:hypothetical protein